MKSPFKSLQFLSRPGHVSHPEVVLSQLPEWKGGLKKGGMKFQSPSLQLEYGICVFVLPPFPPSLFVLSSQGGLSQRGGSPLCRRGRKAPVLGRSYGGLDSISLPGITSERMFQSQKSL